MAATSGAETCATGGLGLTARVAFARCGNRVTMWMRAGRPGCSVAGGCRSDRGPVDSEGRPGKEDEVEFTRASSVHHYRAMEKSKKKKGTKKTKKREKGSMEAMASSGPGGGW